MPVGQGEVYRQNQATNAGANDYWSSNPKKADPNAGAPGKSTFEDPTKNKLTVDYNDKNSLIYNANWLVQYAKGLEAHFKPLLAAQAAAEKIDLRAGLFPEAFDYNNMGAGVSKLYQNNFNNIVKAFQQLQATMEDLSKKYTTLDKANEEEVAALNKAFDTFDSTVHKNTM